jgi:hypothetical protein
MLHRQTSCLPIEGVCGKEFTRGSRKHHVLFTRLFESYAGDVAGRGLLRGELVELMPG